jgi:hypothetical protein
MRINSKTISSALLVTTLMASVAWGKKQAQSTVVKDKAPPTAPPTNEPPETMTDVKGTIAPPPSATPAPFKVESTKETKETTKETTTEVTHSTNSSRPLLGAHAALGFPHVLTAGLDLVTPGRAWGFALIAGAFTASGPESTNVGMTNTELQLRYHPWASAFYVGLGAGSHQVKIDKTETIQGNSVKAEATVKASYLKPQFGWIWQYDSGFSIGMEFGYLSPSGSTTDFTSNAPAPAQATPEYANLEKDVKDNGDKFGKMGLPFVSLIRLGWMF